MHVHTLNRAPLVQRLFVWSARKIRGKFNRPFLHRVALEGFKTLPVLIMHIFKYINVCVSRINFTDSYSCVTAVLVKILEFLDYPDTVIASKI